MARLEDLIPTSRANIENLDCPQFTDRPWVRPAPLAEQHLALISSAGLMRRGEPTVSRGEAGYREIPHDTPATDLWMSHVSVNFDRTGFQQDLNVVLPRQRLDELAGQKIIAGAAPVHYSFMGATDPTAMADYAREVADQLHAAKVDSALLLPV